MINRQIINAYVRRECVKRTLTTSVVRSIPVPEFSDVQISKIEQCYLSIKEAYALDDKEKVEEVQEKIDDIIFEAFELGKDEREKITKFFEVYTRDGDNSPSANVELEEYHNISGQVEKIDTERMYCTVYLAEFGEQEIKLKNQCQDGFCDKEQNFQRNIMKESFLRLNH